MRRREQTKSKALCTLSAVHCASSFGEFFFAVVVLLHMALSLVGDEVGIKMRVMLVAGFFSNFDA